MTKKNYDFDIFEALRRADRKDYEWFKDLSQKEKDAFSPWLAMRFMSAAPNGFEGMSSILLTNMALNEGFNVISKDKELFYRLMCVAGTGKATRHYMPKPPKKRTQSPLINELMEVILEEPLEDDELVMFLKNNDFTKEDIEDLAYELSWDNNKIKEAKKSFQNLMNNESN